MENLYKIGELAEMCNTTLKTIRYYQEEGLISATEVDKDNGYNYYSLDTVIQLQNILTLRSLGFSIDEIKNYNKESDIEKIKKLEKTLDKTKKQISALIKRVYTKSKDLPYFINDEDALGKWRHIGRAKSEESFLKGDIKEGNPGLSGLYLYFLNNGAPYGAVEGWSKGKINLGLGIYDYKIKGDNLFLYIKNIKDELMYIQIYIREDREKRDVAPSSYLDDVNVEIIEDKEVVGLWEIYDNFPYYLNSEYFPEEKNPNVKNCFFRSLAFKTNGLCLIDQSPEIKTSIYTKGKILNKKDKIAENYRIITKGEEKFLVIEYKNCERYPYNGIIDYCYVFKKV